MTSKSHGPSHWSLLSVEGWGVYDEDTHGITDTGRQGKPASLPGCGDLCRSSGDNRDGQQHRALTQSQSK